VIGRQPGEGPLDVHAVRRDDDLLNALGARGHVDAGDEVARLLSELAADVDDGLTDLLDASAGDIEAVLTVGPDSGDRRAARPGRRRTAYTAVTAVVVGATLSVSGVAAAVTGDPFAPYAAVGAVLPWGDDDLPPNAAEVAWLQRALAGARADLARGDVAGAQARLDDVRALLDGADLDDGQRAAVERRLGRLGDRLERAGGPATPAAGSGSGSARDEAKADPHGGKGRADRAPEGPGAGRQGGTAGSDNQGGTAGSDERGGSAGSDERGGSAGSDEQGGSAGSDEQKGTSRPDKQDDAPRQDEPPEAGSPEQKQSQGVKGSSGSKAG
jgi:hypothetical protein